MTTTLAANIKREREARGWSQEELAVLALGGKQNQAQLSRYENGHNIPSLSTLERLAKAFSLRTADLIHDASSQEESA